MTVQSKMKRRFFALVLANTIGATLCFSPAATADAVGVVPLHRLTPSDLEPGDAFLPVAASGSTVVVGAVGDDDNGASSGSAYVFDTETGSELFKITPSDGAANDQFGRVALSGNTAVVGARFDDDNGTSSGSAYVFDTDTASELLKLTPSDGARSDLFGNSVAVSGNTAVVGAPLDDDNGRDSGSAYVFDTLTGNELFKLTASDGAADDEFGWTVAIWGTTAVVGAEKNEAAYVFDTTTGNELFKLTASDGEAGDLFGSSVAIWGSTVVVGAESGQELPGGAPSGGPGSVYVFDAQTGNELRKLTLSNGSVGDRFGFSADVNANFILVGTRKQAAYLFDRDTRQVARAETELRYATLEGMSFLFPPGSST